jgi:hypothetical protein
MTAAPAPSPAPALSWTAEVDTIAAAVLGCAGVSGLDAGRFGEVASYLPGRRVPGVAADAGRVRVRVRSAWGVPAADLAARITAAVTPLAGTRPVDVTIGDVDDPPPGGRDVAGGKR